MNKFAFDLGLKYIERELPKFDPEVREIIQQAIEEEDVDFLIAYLLKYVYKFVPPSPEEFIDPANEYISDYYAKTIYATVKEDFLTIFNPENIFRQVVSYGATRTGKSTLARLCVYFTQWFSNSLVDMNQFFGVGGGTNLAIYLLAFKLEKTKQVLLTPFRKLLKASPRTIKVKFQDKVVETQEKYGNDYFVYSDASDTGEITIASGLQLLVGNDDPLEIIGADILQMYISEIMFFINKAGATEEEIFQLYTDGLDRMDATVGHKFMSFMFLDSSANRSDSVLENHILNEVPKEENVYFTHRSRWEAAPDKYPKWLKTGETFNVITGNSKYPVKLHPTEEEILNTPRDLVLKVPIDALEFFERNIVKSIKDIGGRPSLYEGRLVENPAIILQMFDDFNLKNIEGGIVLDSQDSPDKLLFNKLIHILVKRNGDSYIPIRAPYAPRFIGLDLAYSQNNDLAGIGIVHKEYLESQNNKVLFMFDCLLPLLPGLKGINLDAIMDFIVNLKKEANFPIRKVFADQFSFGHLQSVSRQGIPVEKHSVVSSIIPYQNFLSYIINGQVYSGRNIFFKNNMNSISVQSKTLPNGKKLEQIDHSKGKINHEYNGDFDISTCGINEKDVSDAGCQAFSAAYSDTDLPEYSFERENFRVNPTKESTQDAILSAYRLMRRLK